MRRNDLKLLQSSIHQVYKETKKQNLMERYGFMAVLVVIFMLNFFKCGQSNLKPHQQCTLKNNILLKNDDYTISLDMALL